MSIILKNIKKHYYIGHEKIKACNVDFLEFVDGKFYAITGPSASGKTSLLNIITGIVQPCAGSVLINGTDITKLDSRKKAELRIDNIGLIFQNDLLIDELTINENMNIISQLSSKEIKIDVIHFSRIFGIEKELDKFPPQLSRGQRQRAAVLRSILFDQPILVADEPTANLDSVNAETIYSFFRELADRGKTIIIAAHDKNILNYSDIVYNIKDGNLEQFKS